LTIGAISGGSVIKIGRKKSFIYASSIALFGTLLQMFESLPCILIGRLIYGLGCGVLSIVAPRYIEETVPDHKLSLYTPLFMCSVAFGSMIALLLGAGLPDEEDAKGLKESGFWRVIIGIPMVLQVASIASMIFLIRFDSVRSLIFHGEYT
jgi:MFS family permease